MEDFQGSRPTVEKRVVPDESDPGSDDARMRILKPVGANGRVGTRFRRSRPVSSESGLFVHAPAGAPDPAFL